MPGAARAIVLSAGLGTRLRPLTDELPKPLVPVGDRPLVAHIAERLARAGYDSLVLNTHHRAEHFESRIEHLGVEVHLVHEPSIRGTAGGVAGARALFGAPPVVAWNGDIIADPPLPELVAAANTGLVFVVAPRPLGEGTVGLGDDGRVVRLRGETFGHETASGDYVGIAALGAEVLKTLPDEGCLVGDVALPLLRSGDRVATVVTRARWADLGSLQEYLSENLWWLEEAAAAGPRSSFVHPSARVSPRVTLVRSIVGEGAVVEGEGELVETVVWPGARAVAPLRRTVVTTEGRQVVIP